MMSATDKLHKLYATDIQPIVWARSVGVEVLNELDSVKAAIMMTAGAQEKNKTGTRSAGWNFAGDVVETVATTVKTAGFLKDLVGNALGSVLKNISNKMA
jgi:ubiquinone biosynthesis monooxygenase Coq6